MCFGLRFGRYDPDRKPSDHRGGEIEGGVGDYVTYCGCEKCAPGKSECLHWFFIVILGVGAVLGGLYGAKETIQTIESYNLKLKNGSEELSMVNVLVVFKTVAIYLPGDNFANLSQTQTLYDYESGWSSVIDLDNQICFIQKMNRIDGDSFEKMKESVMQRKQIDTTITSDTPEERGVTPASSETLSELGSYTMGRCKGWKFLQLGAKLASTNTNANCTDSFIPHFVLTQRDGSDRLELNEVNRIRTLCAADQ